MRCIFKYFIICVIGLSFLAEGHGETLIIGNDQWPPYQGKEFKHGGIYTFIVTKAFELEGIQVDHHWIPWARIMLDVKNGKYDGINGVAWNEERDKFLYFTDTIITTHRHFFHLKKNPFDWKTAEDLKGKKIGAKEGYYYGDFFSNAEKSKLIWVRRVTEHKQSFKMLLAGRIDLYIISKDIGQYLLRTLLTPKEAALITFHPKPIHSPKFSLGLSKKIERSPRIIKLFNKGLKRMKENGQLDKLWKSFDQGDFDPQR